MNKYNQEDNIEFVNNTLGNGMWVQVCGYIGDGKEKYLFSVLIKQENSKDFLNKLGFGVCSEEPVGFTKTGNEVVYNMYQKEGICYFVRFRNYHGIHADYYELSDEFLLNFNAYKQDDKYFSVLEDGRTEEIARYHPNGSIEVKNSYLRRFAAIRQMNIAFEFDFRYSSNEHYGDDINNEFAFENNNIKYEFYFGDTGISENRYFSRLLGRKIVECGPIESSGIWPFEKAIKYDDFIVGYDSSGNPIRSTCNPNLLNNYFNSNPGKYHYLTPVAFKREVLKKYIDHPDIYSIENSHLSCGLLWGIELDLDHDNLVFAYLGDLGRDLPESEHPHWQDFNVVTEERLSDSTIKRDFGGMFAEPNNIDFKFQKAFNDTNQKWVEKLGWELFVHLTDSDAYCYKNAIMPLVNEQHEFDSLCLILSKITIDSLNVEALRRAESSIPKDANGSISILECFLKAKGVDEEILKGIISKLRCVQSLRSQLTSHRKSNDINSTYVRYGIDGFISKRDFISASKNVFTLITEALNGISAIIALL